MEKGADGMTKLEQAIEYFDGYGSPYDDLVLKALEKQIPKKPTFYEQHIPTWSCPNCGRLYWERRHIGNYCESCGQRLEEKT